MIIFDLTSPFTSGANLGDRIRMMELSGDPMMFIRSMASLGNLGGLTASTRDVVWAMDDEDYNPIIFETVGSYYAPSFSLDTTS
jgi:LAO/AO transport system kinase